MRLLNPSFAFEQFWYRLRLTAERCLILDYDGTLAPFRIEREQAVPYDGVRELLRKIHDDGGTRIVVVSGRTIEEVVALLKLERSIEIWGEHGGERLTSAGTRVTAPMSELELSLLQAVDNWTNAEELIDLVEFKRFSRAFHFRGMDELRARDLSRTIISRWQADLEASGFELRQFDGGLEIRSKSISKAGAVKEIVGTGTPDLAVAYLGDDETDEDGFSALPDHGLKVLVRPELRSTKADIWLKPPGELLQFLGLWRDSSRV